MRPNPDKILEKIKSENLSDGMGKLKIFFGYAAGVGKTYSMLEAAHKAHDEGKDVVLGYIEPHARPETAALQEGIESIPKKEIEYNGIILKEFDLDAALERKPEIILVDELAHTNAQGCRHVKRYQDIEELLKAGINVYTTVNVQHIESLNDIVASITGIEVRERIPDRIFDLSYQVELVDIEPEDLIERLNKGKIYKQDRAIAALDNFFTIENLTSLREIALRRCADRVNKISSKSKEGHLINEHILICLSSSPSNKKVIRTAARMADAFKGTFTALYVETSDANEMSKDDEKRLNENFKLAEQLGANITTVYGDDVVFQIAEFARLSNVSKIIIGRSRNKKSLFSSNSSFANRLSVLYPNLDIYIIPDNDVQADSRKRLNTLRKEQFEISMLDLIKSLSILLISTLLGFLFFNLGFSEANIITVYILGVLVTSFVTSRKIYPITSSFVSVLVFNFLFTEPRFTFNAYESGYPVTFLIMFIAAFITGTLTSKIKEQAKQSARFAYRTKVLLDTDQKLQQAKTKEEIITETGNQIVKFLDKTTTIYLSIHGRLMEPLVFRDKNKTDIKEYVSANEQAVAQWVYKNNKHAGATTNTLAGAKCYYLSIRGKEGIYGVVGIAMDKNEEFSMFERSLLISLVNECGVVLENNYLEKKNTKALMEANQEKLRANLLRSISHDLRTPLTSISGNASVLLKDIALNESKKYKLYENIYDDSIWLINLVENLLSVTRIEDGSMNLNIQPELLSEIISEALKHINRKSVEHNIKVEIQDEFIMAKMDSRLIIQVIINIIDNAIKYTPKGSNIIVRVYKKGEYVYTSIIDDGDGISDEGKKNLFKMFYTEGNSVADSRRGLGLGLYLCKTIIKAHGGELTVRDNYPKGTIFTFSLKAQEVKLHE